MRLNIASSEFYFWQVLRILCPFLLSCWSLLFELFKFQGDCPFVFSRSGKNLFFCGFSCLSTLPCSSCSSVLYGFWVLCCREKCVLPRVARMVTGARSTVYVARAFPAASAGTELVWLLILGFADPCGVIWCKVQSEFNIFQMKTQLLQCHWLNNPSFPSPI